MWKKFTGVGGSSKLGARMREEAGKGVGGDEKDSSRSGQWSLLGLDRS